MKLSAAFDIVGQIRFAVTIAFFPTVRAIFNSPSLLINPTALSRVIMAHVWVPFGKGSDAGASGDKKRLITPHSSGVVLDLGAGHGYTANYLQREKVTKYIALEPNVLMHPHIREKAHAAGYTEANGSLLILSCGAEDTVSILSSLHGRADTIISVLSLCTVPAPHQTLHALVQDVLAPGGTLIFYEHVLSPHEDVAWWQRLWSPVWGKVFDGCCLDRPTHLWIKNLVDEDGESPWAEGEISGAEGFDEEEHHLFWRQIGRFVKK
ncbi:S-adenosyl-L-methionine-dependent methyltransferase [Mycena sp. CBHHK59/15]|nr:S-adenosyl-L-methionine-dependent methyltransferase [Mycena sp. CBHHK59/15]